MSRSVPWAELRAAYRAGVGCKELSVRYGVPLTTLYSRRRRESWDAPESRLEDLTARLETLTGALLSAPEGDAVSVRDAKELAALVKDLTALRRGRSEDVPGLIRVELSEDVAPWAE